VFTLYILARPKYHTIKGREVFLNHDNELDECFAISSRFNHEKVANISWMSPTDSQQAGLKYKLTDATQNIGLQTFNCTKSFHRLEYFVQCH
jgi:hypothetical protein